MRAIRLAAVGAADLEAPGAVRGAGMIAETLIEELASALARTFNAACTVEPARLDGGFSFDPARNQYLSTAILRRLTMLPAAREGRVLGLTHLDLFVPVLTFVFGEAQLEGSCALVSAHRLREEFYGLPARPDLLRDRLVKESVHELGHTFGLRHCPRWDCVMASTHAAERLDLKSPGFCSSCLGAVNERW